MKKSILCLLTWSLPFLLMAQSFESAEHNKGIKWVTGLTWEQVKQRAKVENKYIFIDAYTTWCGPCKMMDEYVYSNDTVGDFFNEHFIAVKAQMDVTDKDDQRIKDWYNDATSIKTEYGVEAYPSFIFLSPEGKIVQKEKGYKPVQQFVALGEDALSPGKTYDDPYKEYKALANDYKQGIKHYDRMPEMIRTAMNLDDVNLAREMFKDHLNYVSTLNENERYTKQNIELWNAYILRPDSKAIQFFLKDGSKIDQIIGLKGFSSKAVDKTIQARIVDSFFRMQEGETTIITGKKIPNSEVMFMNLPVRKDGKIEPDYVEAEWKKLKKMISKHFSENYTTRNVFKAKMRWYYQHQNKEGYSKTYFKLLDTNPPSDLVEESDMLNQVAWETFLYTNDKKLLQKALEWMNKITKHGVSEANMLDTYANLLYKLGNTEEAIKWEKKAVSSFTSRASENDENNFKRILEKIRKGEPTYLEKGAIWPKEKYF